MNIEKKPGDLKFLGSDTDLVSLLILLLLLLLFFFFFFFFRPLQKPLSFPNRIETKMTVIDAGVK